jgi:hypothetical protein
MMDAGRVTMHQGPIRDILRRIKRFFRREPDLPDDPYAMVRAPKKPRPPQRSAAAAEPLDWRYQASRFSSLIR